MNDAPLSEAQPVRTKKAPSLKTTWSKAMRKSNLIPAVKNTASAACEYANSKTGARIFPGVDALSEDTGQSRRTIISHMDILEKSGWLKCLMRGKGAVMVDGKRLASEYQLSFPDPDDVYVGKGTVTFARAGQAARKAKREAAEAGGTSATLELDTSAELPLETSAELAPVSSAKLAPTTSATLPPVTSAELPTALTHPELYDNPVLAAEVPAVSLAPASSAASSRAALKARIASKKAGGRPVRAVPLEDTAEWPNIKRRPADMLTKALGHKPSTPQVKELEILLHGGWDLDAACLQISQGEGQEIPTPVGASAGV